MNKVPIPFLSFPLTPHLAEKRLRRRNGQIWLMPENDNYAPIDGTHAEIIGVVKGVVREY